MNRRLLFVVWMLGWPLYGALSDYLEFLEGRHYDETVTGLTALICIIIWFWVATLLWKDGGRR